MLSRSLIEQVHHKLQAQYDFLMLDEQQENADEQEARRNIVGAVGIMKEATRGNKILPQCNYRYGYQRNMLGGNALLAKAKCWEYEQETRLIYYTESKLNSDYVTLTGFPIKAIFMGYRISSKVRDFLKKFVSTHNIDLYQMTFLPDDITRMSARKILDMK